MEHSVRREKVGELKGQWSASFEDELMEVSEPVLLAISILAAGYLTPSEAISFVASLPNVKGVAVGVSKEMHAQETFRVPRERLGWER